MVLSGPCTERTEGRRRPVFPVAQSRHTGLQGEIAGLAARE
jgi:hypothetical protein